MISTPTPLVVYATITDGGLTVCDVRSSPRGPTRFEYKCGEVTTPIHGWDTLIEVLQVATDGPDCRGRVVTPTEEGFDLLASEAAANYRAASPLEQDVEILVEEVRRNTWARWPPLVPQFEALLRQHFSR